MKSSLVEEHVLLSVVNMPLTSRYAHKAITRDCFKKRTKKDTKVFDTEAICKKKKCNIAVFPAGGALFNALSASGKEIIAHCTHGGNLWFLQGQSVRFPHVGVAFQHKHGDHALSRHDNHVGVGNSAMHDGRAQIHGDEVELFH